MKNELPCDIIKDLLPGYIDNLSSSATNAAVEEHLSACPDCRRLKNSMTASPTDNAYVNGGSDTNLFKAVKKRLNKKLRNTLIGASAAVIAVICGFYVLFNIPLKNIDISDISVSANVYPTAELEKSQNGTGLALARDNSAVIISSGEDNKGDIFTITIPDIDNDNINVSADVLDRNDVVSVVSWSSPYFLRHIQYDDRPNDDGIIYVTAFKTTILGNKATEYNSSMLNMEFKKINKIVYVDKNNSQTVLWENKN